MLFYNSKHFMNVYKTNFTLLKRSFQFQTDIVSTVTLGKTVVMDLVLKVNNATREIARHLLHVTRKKIRFLRARPTNRSASAKLQASIILTCNKTALKLAVKILKVCESFL